MKSSALKTAPVSRRQDQSANAVDELDRRIMLATQAGLPRDPRPYHAIAEQIGTTADEVMVRLQRMLDTGVVRRIGPVPNHYKLGYRANGMTVWNVPDEKISALGQRVGALPFVSHCYHRPRNLPDWPYNLFAMVHAESRETAIVLVKQIATLLGPDDHGHDVLFSTRILKKTGVRFMG